VTDFRKAKEIDI
jgi:hypothetical protein